MLFESSNKRHVIGDEIGVPRVQQWLMGFKIIVRLKKPTRLGQQVSHWVKTEKAIATQGVGQFDSRKALDRVKDAAVHCQAVSAKERGQCTIPRARTHSAALTSAVPDHVGLCQLVHGAAESSPCCNVWLCLADGARDWSRTSTAFKGH